MHWYSIISEIDHLDATCFGDTLAEAIEELLHFNGYEDIDDTDWKIKEIQ